MEQDIVCEVDSSAEMLDGRGRAKPTRKVSAELVNYELSLSDIIFRWDSICISIKKQHGSKFSTFQVKVLLALHELLEMQPNALSLSYQAIDTSGMIRGMSWQDVVRSLVILYELGMLVELGKTKGGKHPRYHLSDKGEALVFWINREMCQPVDVLKVNSKMFNAPVPRANQVA